ncbi:MAG: AmmeMemoRadiSam system radical SAM enzyme, partial [Verrucomicrobiota bacterium]
ARIKSVAITAGYIKPKARSEFYKHIDAANIDFKAFTEEFYKSLTLSELKPVLETLKWLKHESDVWFEITNLVIPDENDSDLEFGNMCEWILENLGDDVPVHFSAFHPDFKLTHRPRTPHSTLERAREIALQRGIKFAYIGNVVDVDRESTTCPSCQQLLIERDRYEIGRFAIRDSACSNCGEPIPGVFENQPGAWGRRRIPIQI